MFRNYLVTALRNVGRHKLYSFINIAGLTVALACAIFIMLFLADELSYDRWVPDTGELYRVDLGVQLPGHDVQRSAPTPFILAPTMAAQIPEVVAYTHANPSDVTLKADGRLFSESVVVVDPNFFKVIALPLVAGDPDRVFAQPDFIVLSQTGAKKLFGAADPVGKTVTVDGTHPMTVTGVMRDLPHNSQFDMDFVFPNTSKADPRPASGKTNWFSIGSNSYIRLAPGSDPARVIAKTNRIVDRNINSRKTFGVDIPGSQVMQVHLTPFTAVHLASDYPGGFRPTGSWTEVYGFAAIAALILLIACFNFTNLATARAMMRAREVSLRKVLGARRGQLVVQFLAESALTALVALILALALVEVLTPAFDRFVGRQIALHYLADWQLTLTIAVIAILTGLLAGAYPAFVLSSFRPASALRANRSSQSGSALLRTALVVMQFAISIGLGIAAAVVFMQIRYSQTIDLGFNHAHIVVIANAGDVPKATQESLVQALRAEPSIAAAARSQSTPFREDTNLQNAQLPGSAEQIIVRQWDIDPDYLGLYGVKVIAGRALTRDRAQDAVKKDGDTPVNIMVNAAATRRFGFTPGKAVGKTIRWRKHPATIVGVVGSFRLDGPGNAPEPIVLEYAPDDLGQISVRTKPGQTQAALEAIDRQWHRFAPNSAIQRVFLSDEFAKLFREDQQRGRMFAVFVGVAIFIACLGLYGLAAFTAQRRTKEIGIRKVFGARTRDLVRLLLWQFSIPVLIANAIAWPVAWYYLHGWLQGFASRIWLSPVYFLSAGLVALVIAWATVSAHAIRVARANPVRALRYE